ncbi:MAG: ElyC/SanA/YdcF family protein [Desulfarculaceae bacterium]|jgi:uncharacterized SAM-binding protein YcdF (DUF218 family)
MEAFGFILKKIISRALFPVGAVLWLILLGGLLWWRRPQRRLGPMLVACAFGLLLVLSLPATGWLLLSPLEGAAGDYADPTDLSARGVKNVVVLGAAVWQGQRTPGDSQNGAGLRRLLEGLRLHRGVKGSRLLLSGGVLFQDRTSAQAMRDLALQMGVPSQDLIVERISWDTADQAAQLAKMLGAEPFALVTSASHLPRAMMLFKGRGLNPLPAPADFRTRGFSLSYQALLPSAGGLLGSEMAIYEYMGITWAWLRGLGGNK